eukprot:g1214.t1
MQKLTLFFTLFFAFAGAKVVNVDLYVSWGNVSGRNWVMTNGLPSGPVVYATEGDTLVVRLHNAMPCRWVTVHHHGLHQHSTPFYDGVSGVSQPPIPPSKSFTYRIVAHPSGTQMYHGHYGLAATDGFVGPLIVRSAKPRGIFHGLQDEVLLLKEFQSLGAEETLHQLVEGTYEEGGDEPVSDVSIQDILVNGKPISDFKLDIDAAARLRFLNGGTNWPFKVSLDGHSLLLVSLDGEDVSPVLVQSVVIYPGERVDVIVYSSTGTGGPAGKRKLSVSTPTGKAFGSGEILFRRGPISAELREAVAAADDAWKKETFDPVDSLQFFDPLVKRAAGLDSVPLTAERRITLVLAGSMKEYVWSLNGTRFEPPTYPVRDGVVRSMWHVRLGETVDIELRNPTPMTHPMHLHGHKFWVLGVGPCSQAGEIAANRSAVKKDTLPVPGKACAVLRVTFDNPGPWMFHCHNELHLARGMGGIFVVDHLITAPDGLFSNLSIAEDDINAFCEEQGSAAPRTFMENMDKTVDPCDDFFEYACGNWKRHNPIPDNKNRVSTFSKLWEANKSILRKLLESGGDAATSKAGAFYRACMDEEAIMKQGDAPVQRFIKEAMSKGSLAAKVAFLHKHKVDVFFSAGAGQDDRNSSTNVLFISQSGLSLPGMEYYLGKNVTSDSTLLALQSHISASLALVGEKDVEKAADSVLQVEVSLAKVMAKKEDLRDPLKAYNAMSMAQFPKGFDWSTYVDELLHRQPSKVVVSSPSYLKGLASVISAGSFEQYLKWHIVRSALPHLGPSFLAELLRFERAVFGIKSMPPRWETCVSRTNAALGFITGYYFSKETFTEAAKKKAEEMISDIESAFEKNLNGLAWLQPKDRQAAIYKSRHVDKKIGFPDFILDENRRTSYYSALSISESYFRNVIASRLFNSGKNLAKVGKPVDRAEWQMTPATVNAYYNPTSNEIVFPAGIMQAPFFSHGQPRAANYGSIGVVFGHELSHAFDDSGSQYDAEGNLHKWWSEKTARNFKERTQCMEKQYSEFSAGPHGEHVNGKLTLGENIADSGGLKQAYVALQQRIDAEGSDAPLPGLEDLDADRLFFLSFATVWCRASRPAEAERLLLVDPHSPGRFRVIGALQNSPEFAAAFSCAAGSRMNPYRTCQVW